MSRDDILPSEILFNEHGISVCRTDGKINVRISDALLEDLTVLKTRVTYCQLSGNYAKHAYLSGNQTGTTYALSNLLHRVHSAYNVLRGRVTWRQFRDSEDVRIGLT